MIFFIASPSGSPSPAQDLISWALSLSPSELYSKKRLMSIGIEIIFRQQRISGSVLLRMIPKYMYTNNIDKFS
jgi:hypothetical protein